MIRLFQFNEINFNHNKWILNECISAIVTEDLEGILDLDLEYPILDKKGLSKYLVRGNIIKCPISTTDTRGEQFFKIRTVKTNTNTKKISVYAQAIARAELMTDIVLGVEVPAGKTRKEAVAILLAGCVEHKDYTVGNLDTNTNTSINLGLEEDTGNVINYLDIAYVSPLQGLIGDSQSIQYAYGGEIIFNNKEINFVDQRGSDHSFEIRSGKNLQELEQDIDDTDSENFATALIMCSSDGVYLPNNEIIYSPNANLFDRKFYKKIVCDDVSLVDDSTDALNVVYDQLRERAQKQFDNGIDKLKISNTVNFIQLANTEEYRDYKILEKCELGNNVAIKYYKKNDENKEIYIEATGRIIKIKFNAIKNKIDEVEIGERKKSIIDTITSTSNAVSDAESEIDDTKKSVKDLSVTMEQNDDSILLEVHNNKTDADTKFQVMDGEIQERVTNDEFSSYRTQTAEEINQKVSRGSDFATQIEQNAYSVVIAIHGQSDNQVDIDSNGLTIIDGGFLFKNSYGEDIIKAYTNGAIRLGDSSWTKSHSMNYVLLGGLPMSQYFLTSNIAGDGTLDMNGNDIDNISDLYADWGEVLGDFYVDDTLYCESLEVDGGTKNCAQQTENYGKRLINAYETAEYYFGDLGFGIIQNGECLIAIDPIFLECITTSAGYHVFTQIYNENGSISKIEKNDNYFIVYGTENTEFSWEIKAKRKGFENSRLELSQSTR